MMSTITAVTAAVHFAAVKHGWDEREKRLPKQPHVCNARARRTPSPHASSICSSRCCSLSIYFLPSTILVVRFGSRKATRHKSRPHVPPRLPLRPEPR